MPLPLDAPVSSAPVVPAPTGDVSPTTSTTEPIAPASSEVTSGTDSGLTKTDSTKTDSTATDSVPTDPMPTDSVAANSTTTSSTTSNSTEANSTTSSTAANSITSNSTTVTNNSTTTSSTTTDSTAATNNSTSNGSSTTETATQPSGSASSGSTSSQNSEKVLDKSTTPAVAPVPVTSATLTSPDFGSKFADDLGASPSDLKGLTGDVVNPNFVFNQGVATVGSNGIVKVGYLNDGGKYQGQLVAFSLAGMEYLQNQADFIRIAAERGLSNSKLGAIVIDDLTQGAKYSLKTLDGVDWNRGDVLGDREFLFRAGDRLGFMLVPDGKVKQVAADPTVTGKLAPLFSMPSANANNQFYWGQLADVTGDGSVFVFEDQTTAGVSDRDYNDLIFRLTGATMPAVLLDDVINPEKDWRKTDVGRAIVAEALPYVAPPVTNPGNPNPGNPSDLPPVLDGSNRDPVTRIDRPIPTTDQPTVVLVGGAGGLDGAIDEVRDRWAGQDLSIVNMDTEAAARPGESPASYDWGETLATTIDQAPERAVILLDLALTRQDETGQTVPRYTLTDGERQALERARDRGLLIVIPAGDDGGISPWVAALRDETTGRSVFPNVAVVGAAEVFDPRVAIAKGVNRAPTSDYGDGLAVVADGRWGQANQALPSTRYAAARVAAVASQVWARDPQLAASGVIDDLKRSATDLGPRGYDDQTGAGLLNGIAALSLADLEPTRRLSQDLKLPDRPRASGYKLYNPGEVVQIVGAIAQEAGGSAALSKLQLWLQRDGGAPEAVGQIGFTSSDAGQQYFEAKLQDLAAGKYRLLATPIARGGGQGGTLEIPFVVLSMPVNEGLSPEVRWAAERSTVLESYDPAALAQADRWVVSVRAGEDVSALADRLGADNLGPTGSLPNTFYWQFPAVGRPSPQAIAAALEAQPTIEFAQPIVAQSLTSYGLPWHIDAAAAGNVPADARIKQAWDNYRVSGNGVVVAIIDDSFQLSHEALASSRYLSSLSKDVDKPSKTTNKPIPAISQYLTANVEFSEFALIGHVVGDAVEIRLKNTDLQNPLFDDPISKVSIDYLSIVDSDSGSVLTSEEISKLVKVTLIHPDGSQFIVPPDQLALLDKQPIDISKFNNKSGANFVKPPAPGLPPIPSPWKLKIENLNDRSLALDFDSANRKSKTFSFNVETQSFHGTSVAAIAIGNTLDGANVSGVAPGADFAAVRVGADGTNLIELVSAFRPSSAGANDQIQVKNGSFGLGLTTVIAPEIVQAIQDGDHNSTILNPTNLTSYVFAAGNERANVDFNGLANLKESIAVGAIGQDGKPALHPITGLPYSNYGSSLFVMAPTGLRTADVTGAAGYSPTDYTNTFGGTSAAAPVVSGVIALMKEARTKAIKAATEAAQAKGEEPPKLLPLTWQDIQHILAQSARRDLFLADDPNNPDGWSGKVGDLVRHSPYYGFGLVDADAAVLLASTWQNVTSLTIKSPELSPELKGAFVTVSGTEVQSQPVIVTPLDAAGKTIDWVQVGVNLAYDNPKNLELTLTHTYVDSTGTTKTSRSILTDVDSSRNVDKNWISSETSVNDWVFSSAHHWGEPANGTWTVTAVDKTAKDKPLEQKQFLSWDLSLYGIATEPITKPIVSVVARDAKATEDGNAGVFLLQRTNADLSKPLTVNYAVGGSATPGTDYRAMSGTVTFAAGQQYVMASVIPIYDYLLEGTETVALTLKNQPDVYELSANSQATVLIDDATANPNNAAQIFSNPTTGNLYFVNAKDTALGAEFQAREFGLDLTSIQSANENQWLASTFQGSHRWIGLTDSEIFGATEGKFQWFDGSPFSYINPDFDHNNFTGFNPDGEDYVHLHEVILGQWNDLPEDPEILKIPGWRPVGGIVEFNPNKRVKPIVNLSVTDSLANEQGDQGSITISRVGPVDQPLTVNYDTLGTATNQLDYSIGDVVSTRQFSGTVTATIGAFIRTAPTTAASATNIGSVPFQTVLTFDGWAAGDKFIDYRSGLGPNAADGRWLRLAGTNNWVSASIVDAQIPASTKQITIPAGQSTLTIPIVGVPDDLAENRETAFIQLTDSPTYTVGTHNIGRINIGDLGSTGPWLVQYWNNTNQTGAPVFTTTERAGGIFFNYQEGSPTNATGVNADNFSARWTTTSDFAGGFYKFLTQADDGLRVFVDGILANEKWGAVDPWSPHIAHILLPKGKHDIRVDYFEQSFLSAMNFDWQPTGLQEGYSGAFNAVGYRPDSSSVASPDYPVPYLDSDYTLPYNFTGGVDRFGYPTTPVQTLVNDISIQRFAAGSEHIGAFIQKGSQSARWVGGEIYEKSLLLDGDTNYGFGDATSDATDINGGLKKLDAGGAVVQSFSGYPNGIANKVWVSKYGAQPTWGGIGGTWEALGGPNSQYGFPLDRERSDGKGWVIQRYEGGNIFWNPNTGTIRKEPSATRYSPPVTNPELSELILGTGSDGLLTQTDYSFSSPSGQTHMGDTDLNFRVNGANNGGDPALVKLAQANPDRLVARFALKAHDSADGYSLMTDNLTSAYANPQSAINTGLYLGSTEHDPILNGSQSFIEVPYDPLTGATVTLPRDRWITPDLDFKVDIVDKATSKTVFKTPAPVLFDGLQPWELPILSSGASVSMF